MPLSKFKFKFIFHQLYNTTTNWIVVLFLPADVRKVHAYKPSSLASLFISGVGCPESTGHNFLYSLGASSGLVGVCGSAAVKGVISNGLLGSWEGPRTVILERGGGVGCLVFSPLGQRGVRLLLLDQTEVMSGVGLCHT